MNFVAWNAESILINSKQMYLRRVLIWYARIAATFRLPQLRDACDSWRIVFSNVKCEIGGVFPHREFIPETLKFFVVEHCHITVAIFHGDMHLWSATLSFHKSHRSRRR